MSIEDVIQMFVTVAVVALLVFAIQMVCKRYFPYILRVPNHYMYSALLVICLASAYVDSGNLYKVGMMMFFCFVGILMAAGGLPNSPLILAFILGPIMEKNMLRAFQYTGTWTTFFTRPVSGVLMVVAIFCVLSPIFTAVIGRLKKKKESV